MSYATDENNNNNKSNDSIDWSDIFENKLSGEQPLDIKLKLHQLCKEYLGDVWRTASLEEIIIQRINGGLTNQLYRISTHIKKSDVKLTEFVIRLYGKKFQSCYESNENERFNDAIIGIIMSENKLGPKIYGLFENGEILKFYKHHQFHLKQQRDPVLVKELAQQLAKLHSLKVPIKKNEGLIFDMIDEYYKNSYKRFPIDQLIDDCNCETLKKANIKQEIEWISKLGNASNSPIVFTHFDFRGSNILVIDSEVIDSEMESRIVLCDYEYANYYHRGIDFSSIFNEWGRPLNEWMNLSEFPTDSMLKPFISAYIGESAKINGNEFVNNSLNSIEHIIYETKVFILVRYLYWTVITLWMNVDEMGSSLFNDKNKHMVVMNAVLL